jgi:RHS repeat-associated protein
MQTRHWQRFCRKSTASQSHAHQWHFERYNNRSQLTGVAEQMNNQSGAQLFNFSANWVNPAGHNNGTLQGLTIGGTGGPTFAQSFSYDPLNRLTSASESGSWSQAYNYDQYGNMWMPTSSGLPAPSLGPAAPTTNAYSASGPGNNRNTNSTYDAAGNLTVFGAMNVSYDAENRQTAVGSNSYSYDGFGLRVGKTTANGTTVYVYDAFGQLAAEYGSATTNSLCKTCYLSGDHLGSLRLVTDQNGSAIARHDYAPFGQEIPAGIGQRSLAWGASDNVNQKFTGQIRDSETNLDFFNARYMSSGLGRFMSPDPANAGADPTDPQTWNAYAYVRNSPMHLTDPSGFCTYVGPQAMSADDLANPDNYIDEIGETQTCPEAFNLGNNSAVSATTSADVSQVSVQDLVDFFKYWLSGELPASIDYGPNDGMTKLLANSGVVSSIRTWYTSQGCPSEANNIDSLHFPPFVEGVLRANKALFQIGGFQTNIATVGNSTTFFTITNVAGQASFSGASSFPGLMAGIQATYQVGMLPGSALGPLVAGGIADNPNGPTGPRHNVRQNFTWAESRLCKQ